MSTAEQQSPRSATTRGSSDGTRVEPDSNVDAETSPPVHATSVGGMDDSVVPMVPRRRWRLRRLITLPVKLFIGVIFTQSMLLSVLVIGWTHRLMQRSALKTWHRRRGEQATCPAAFVDFARGTQAADVTAGDAAAAAGNRSADDLWREHARAPHWIIHANPILRVRRGAAEKKHIRAAIAATFGSLGVNFKLGLQGLLTTWTLTLPAGLLWLASWWGGWNNSFNKGYEHAAVGPAVGVLGVVLFIAAMTYAPIAQARQAVTGDWRTFYDFRFNRRLIRRAAIGSLVIAASYALLGAVAMGLKTGPLFFQYGDAMDAMTDAEVLKHLNTYYFWSGVVVFISFVGLRLLASRTYAKALAGAVRDRAVSPDSLHLYERRALGEFDLLRPATDRARPVVVRAAVWTTANVARWGLVSLVCVFWFAFVASIFVSEFLNYHPYIGFLNQPLVQLPFFKYVPAPLTP